ncbi:cytochrome P450 2B9-like [Terrapene carolina triunguis]|uniref:cytochrome P450 2B9-like n=1 Tax=Terrapene triunguis TaxID=2587831 RepID=UPI000E7743FA|nr:cytochrome P450 2B9-like [Terrapene carolina triunguis]
MVAYPDVQEKVQKELDAELGPSQLIRYEDRKNLPYTNAVIHEIQRYSNIVPVGLPRQCVKDTMLQGFPIEKVQSRSLSFHQRANVLRIQLIGVSTYTVDLSFFCFAAPPLSSNT